MRYAATDHRERIVTIAGQALETTIAHQLTNWTALTASTGAR
jgi:hypothetical protein